MTKLQLILNQNEMTQAQLIANTELTTADSVFRDMNEQASQLVTSLYQVMEEKYKWAGIWNNISICEPINQYCNSR